MTKLVNFDAETLNSSLEGTHPCPKWVLCLALLAQYLHYSSLFSCNFFQKSLLCTTANCSNWQSVHFQTCYFYQDYYLLKQNVNSTIKINDLGQNVYNPVSGIKTY